MEKPRIERFEHTTIVVNGQGRDRVFSVEIDHERGPVSSSGLLLAECGDGQRVAIDALNLLSEVYEAGRRHGKAE